MNEWWRGAVIYQIYPRSFQDSDGDGIGDLPGIIDRLEHIAELGADAIWISPFFRSPMKDFGYDIAGYTEIDPMFGTLEDYDRLIATAHELGLKVVIDQVYSHSSDLCPWFEESRQARTGPKADWYVWADPKPDGTPPNNWLSVFGGPAWDWEPRRRQYYLHNFLAEQPDLNLLNPVVQDAVLDVARFWLDRGTDGFRLDVVNFYAHDAELRDNPPRPHPDPVKPYWLQRPLYNRSRPETFPVIERLRGVLDEYDARMLVGEIASEKPLEDLVEYTDGVKRLHTAYTFVFLRDPVDAGGVRSALEAVAQAPDGAWPSWAFSNHDVPRVVTRWGAGRDRAAFAKQMIALLCSLRGTAFLYQGEELGLPNADVPFEDLQDPEGIRFWPNHISRDNARTPMVWEASAHNAGFSDGVPWLPVDIAQRTLAVDRQAGDPSSVLAFTKRFLAWRKTKPALVTGDIRFFDLPEPVLGFERFGAGGEALVCLFNLGTEPVRIRLPMEVRPLDQDLALPGEVDGDLADLPVCAAVFARP
ncbi:MAG: alpha-glucosidase [Rhodospirillaceae bacterium]|nr:alpha-glucosidase [Rhodospirillaceae bacterium]